MKKQVIVIILLGASLFVSAQKGNWTIGLYSGVQGQIISSHLDEYYRTIPNPDTIIIIDKWNPTRMGVKHTFSNTPPVELNVKYNIRNRFSFAFGLGYRSYYAKVKDVFDFCFTSKADYFQVPIIFQYDMPLKKQGFSFFLQWGLCFDIMRNSRGWGYSPSEYHDFMTDKLLSVETSINPSWGEVLFNPLFHTGFGFSYQFNSGFGIAVSGKHNIGLTYINTLSYHIQLKDTQTGIIEREVKEQLYCRSESWNVLVGLTYTFKKKEKIG